MKNIIIYNILKISLGVKNFWLEALTKQGK